MDINVFYLCLTLLSAGLLAYLCAYQPQDEKTQNKKSSWQSLGHWAVLFVCIASVVFLSTAAGIYWNNQEDSDFWNLATIVFTFFGVLLTAGAAFATVAAVISYFSVNKKLKKAKSSLKKTKEIQDSLKKARSSLNEFEKLDQERRELRQELETLASYQAVVQDLQQYNAVDIDEEMQQKILQAARQILDNPQAGFEARLKARAIIQDFGIPTELEEVRANPSEEAWQKVITIRQDNLMVWRLFFQIAPKKEENNYVHALFSYGVILNFSATYFRQQNQINKAVLQWQQARQQFARILTLKPDMYPATANLGIVLAAEGEAILVSGDLEAARKLWKTAKEKFQQVLEMKPDMHEVINNWGALLKEEARAVAASGDLETARALWKTAGEKYRLALEIKSDKHQAAHNWLLTLKDEAAYLSDTEQIQLWQNAKSQVLKLQNHSPEHQQSKVIQDLLNGIANAIVIQFPQQERKP